MNKHTEEEYEHLSNMEEWADGAGAGSSGYLRTSNPHPLDSDEHKAWDLGWAEESEESAIARAQEGGEG